MVTITTFYSIPIPEPVSSADQNELAQIMTPDGPVRVRWMNSTGQVILCYNGAWYIQPNARIEDSIASLMGYHPVDMRPSGMLLFDRDYHHGKAAEEREERAVLDCEWSDYACDKMLFQVNVDVVGMEADYDEFVE